MLSAKATSLPGLAQGWPLSPAQPRAAMGLRFRSLETRRPPMALSGSTAIPRRCWHACCRALGATAWPYRCAPVAAMARPAATLASRGTLSPATCYCCPSPVIAPTQRCWGFSKDAPGRAANSTHATGTARHARQTPLPRRRRGPARTRTNRRIPVSF
ncbi:hypothetical protein ACPA9J_08075 [Pseudomonas aeruginosa]